MEFIILLLLVGCPAAVWSHARLMSPPSRSSMWRLGFPTKKNFNDNALYCGGITIQWQKNGGKCGICGDPYDMPHPRDNEAGGKYGRGIISKRYVSGQVIQATVEVTTNHRGYFEFKLCPNNNPKKEATQECLDKYVLREAGGKGNRYYIGDKGNGAISVKLQLPKSLTCSQCVFQWTYVAGNNWGKCEDGESRLGCGPQETFRGCADIAIDTNPKIFNVKSNENDLENNRDFTHKNNKNPRGIHSKTTSTTTAKPVVYTYEVTRQYRGNTSTAFSHENANNSQHHQISHENADHSHHQDHSHNHPKEIHNKTVETLPPSAVQPGRSNKKKPGILNHHNRVHNGSEKYPKYDYRHFHFHNNNISFSQLAPGKGIFKQNNTTWPFGYGQIYFNVGNRRVRIKHDVVKPEQRFFNLTSSSDSGYSVNLPNGFTLGGKRYKDFWFL